MEGGVKKEAMTTLDEIEIKASTFYREGDQVEVDHLGTGQFIPARITGVHPNGTYDIYYEGQTETDVALDLIRSIGQTRRPPAQRRTKLQDTKDRMTMLLISTVFPNAFWIVDVLRGLIRHDHTAMLRLIDQDRSMPVKVKNQMRRRVHRLMQRGLLHSSLLPYIWSGVAGLHEDPRKNDDEFRRLLALLGVFDMLMDRPGDRAGTEWVVPCLSAGKHSRTVSGDVFVDDSLPFFCRIVYDALPPYFDMMLVAHIMNSGSAQSVDFIEGAAAFRKFGDKALLFAGNAKVVDPRGVFRVEQLENALSEKIRDNQCHVVITSSSRRLLRCMEQEVNTLEAFFPGLQRLATLFPCYSCRCNRQKMQLSAQTRSQGRSFKSIRKLPVAAGDEKAEYLLAEKKELARLAQLAEFDQDESVRSRKISGSDIEKVFPTAGKAFTDFPDFKNIVNMEDPNNPRGVRMHVYCPDGASVSARYVKEVISFNVLKLACQPTISHSKRSFFM
jgi:hypothetical protein